MSSDTHLVFGAGLIGSYIAGGLISAGLRTHLVARERARSAMANGLFISDYQGEKKNLLQPQFVSSQNEAKTNYNFIWLTVKSTAMASACESLDAFINPATVIICCQNGFGSDQIIRDAFPSNDVLRAIVGFNVIEQKPGYFHRSTEGRLVIERPTDLHSVPASKVDSIAASLNTKMLPTVISPEIEAEQWAKLQLNLSNPVGALSNIPVKQMLEDKGFRTIIAHLMTELLNVTSARDIKLAKINVVPGHWIPHILRLPDILFRLIGRKMIDVDPTARLSMWWDLHQGKPTEIDFLNGSLVRSGAEVGVACPFNKSIVGLIKKMQENNDRPTLTSQELINMLEAAND